MNRAQQQLVWSGAVVAALLGVAAAKELSRPANCKDDLIRWVDGGGRTTTSKVRTCQ